MIRPRGESADCRHSGDLDAERRDACLPKARLSQAHLTKGRTTMTLLEPKLASNEESAPSEEMARLAINANYTCNMHDPRHAQYLRPLSIAADEEMAHEMAAAIYGPAVEERGASGEAYSQCLVDARRMLRDREYWGLFADDAYFIPPLN
jgi:hypothetical protein